MALPIEKCQTGNGAPAPLFLASRFCTVLVGFVPEDIRQRFNQVW
jgi:hypothetical protein